MKKVLIYVLIIILVNLPVFAVEFDTSIDDEIRKNYNPTKIEDDVLLPSLPKITNTDIQDSSHKVKVTSSRYVSKTKNNYRPEQSYIVIKKGTVIKLKLLNHISDLSAKGSKLTFVSTYPVSTTYYTIPAGTIFKGVIVNSHAPQLSGNGGLIVININSIILNDEVQPIEANVIKVNSKFIFLNNIKGERKYIVSMFKSTKPGCHFFKKMLGVTRNLATDGSSIILTPFSLTAGILAFGGNLFISPALALFYKGNSIHIQEGSKVEAKLMQNVFIYN